MTLNRTSKFTFLLFCTLLCLLQFACTEGDDTELGYDIPTTYNFENVSYEGQTTRLNMLAEMVTLMKTGNTSGTVIDSDILKKMYRNEDSPFENATLNASSKQLKNKCFEPDQALFETYMDNLAIASTSTESGSNGTAGVVISNNGNSQYLLDENGIEYTQLIEKGLMGAVFFYQIAEVYLGEDKQGATVDNETVTVGEGTEMEHHWDEAFGYFGVPTNFPTNTDDARFIGKYCNDRDNLLGLNANIMDAYRTGRAAISNKDLTTRDAQIPILRDNIEKVFAATAIHYLNGGIADFADHALRNHQLSEAIAFTRGLKYNPTRKITPEEIDEVLDFIGSNLYEATVANLNAAKDMISTLYGFDDVKDNL